MPVLNTRSPSRWNRTSCTNLRRVGPIHWVRESVMQVRPSEEPTPPNLRPRLELNQVNRFRRPALQSVPGGFVVTVTVAVLRGIEPPFLP